MLLIRKEGMTRMPRLQLSCRLMTSPHVKFNTGILNSSFCPIGQLSWQEEADMAKE